MVTDVATGVATDVLDVRGGGPIRRMWRAMAGQQRELVGAVLVGSAASLCAVALLGTSAWLISSAAEMPPVLTLTVAAVMVRFFALGRAVFRYVERLVGHDAAFRGLTQLREHVYLQLERIAPVGLARFARGDLLNRMVADVDAALDLPLRVILPWIQAGLVLLACVAGLTWLLPAAGAWIAIIGAGALLASPWIASALALRAERRLAPQRAELTGVVVTTLTASADLLAYGAMDQALARIRAVDDEGTRLLRRESGALGMGGGLAILLQGMAVTGVLVVGIPAVVRGALAPPWLAVLALVPLALFDIMGTLPSAALALQRLRGSADRLAEIDRAPDPVHPPIAPVLLAGDPGNDGMTIDVVGLRASWSPDSPDVLHDLTFTVPAGSHLSIVGPSGSGKSTLAAVLMGFLDYRGSVRLNGHEIRDCDPSSLRQHIGILSQRSHVFDTTIEENVLLGRLVEGPDEVWRALQGAHLDDAVRAMPRGLQTPVGTFGWALSGGEAQRLSLARLLVEPRAVLVLDEPTEHLDPETASGIEETLRIVAHGRTRILITHRVSSIAEHERVIVLQSGTLTERGTARELVRARGWFAEQLAREGQDADMASLVAALPIGRGTPAGGSTRAMMDA